MVAGGEDPLYIARRLVRFASEDVGLADPQALSLTLAARDAYDFLGSPEGELALAEAVVYLASAPKSNRVYAAFTKAMKDVEASPYEPVPLQLRNAVTRLMKDLSYGEGYEYAHDSPFETTDMQTFPDRFKDRVYYVPGDLGKEQDIRKRMDWWQSLKAKIKSEQAAKKKGPPPAGGSS
jgi:putative ATPase